MDRELTRGARELYALRAMARPQAGVISVGQAAEAGVMLDRIRRHLSAGRLVRLHEGVYLTGNMRPSPASLRWAALLASGDGAVLSHSTAAEIHGFGRAVRTAAYIEVSIPAERQEVAVRGVRVRRSRLLPAKATVVDGWPITTAADTVLDLVAEMRSPHNVVGLLTDACRTRVVTAEEILRVMGRRRRQRFRQLVKDVLTDVIGGVESPLEHRYLVTVERAHGLPQGRRQVKDHVDGLAIYRDVEYDQYDTVVELDGRAGHEGSGRHRDRRRDNAGTVRRKATLRYGHADLTQPCEVAVEVASVLRDRGWTGRPRPCGPRCRAVNFSQRVT